MSNSRHDREKRCRKHFQLYVLTRYSEASAMLEPVFMNYSYNKITELEAYGQFLNFKSYNIRCPECGFCLVNCSFIHKKIVIIYFVNRKIRSHYLTVLRR